MVSASVWRKCPIWLGISNAGSYRLREREASWRLASQQPLLTRYIYLQLLCVVIVFTYAVISPIILPFGLIYFLGALTVYKKQILYVYSPVYESGGAMFPLAVQRTLFGLVCSQLTFWGYLLTRKCIYQPVFLFPLPVLTVLGMNFLHRTYAVPSQRLSLERARECDRLSSLEQQRRSFRQGESPARKLHSQVRQESSRNLFDHGVEARRTDFDRSKYRQPVLTEVAAEPWTYRRGLADDTETVSVKQQLRQINRYIVAHAEAERQRLGNLASPP